MRTGIKNIIPPQHRLLDRRPIRTRTAHPADDARDTAVLVSVAAAFAVLLAVQVLAPEHARVPVYTPCQHAFLLAHEAGEGDAVVVLLALRPEQHVVRFARPGVVDLKRSVLAAGDDVVVVE